MNTSEHMQVTLLYEQRMVESPKCIGHTKAPPNFYAYSTPYCPRTHQLSFNHDQNLYTFFASKQNTFHSIDLDHNAKYSINLRPTITENTNKTLRHSQIRLHNQVSK